MPPNHEKGRLLAPMPASVSHHTSVVARTYEYGARARGAETKRINRTDQQHKHWLVYTPHASQYNTNIRLTAVRHYKTC